MSEEDNKTSSLFHKCIRPLLDSLPSNCRPERVANILLGNVYILLKCNISDVYVITKLISKELGTRKAFREKESSSSENSAYTKVAEIKGGAALYNELLFGDLLNHSRGRNNYTNPLTIQTLSELTII
ncbi:hypothetical protein H8356DRAFT_1359634 [Neocallimastix lanati (nom. inval.)]|nr:hypothetical protein H8356DRAFT_1359634 [Neocallimastix sp. JGI-2020a]